MSGVITRAGHRHQIDLLVRSGLVLRLFTNDIEPAFGDTAAAYTELVDHGYRPRALAADGWKTRKAGGVEYPEQTYTMRAHQDVYGYYLTLESTGDLIAAERFFGAPYRIDPTDQIRITPGIS